MNKIELNNKLRRFFTRFGGGGIKPLTVKPISIGGNNDGSINFDELAEKFKNFYIYPKKDKARFFQDGVDGEYDASKS